MKGEQTSETIQRNITETSAETTKNDTFKTETGQTDNDALFTSDLDFLILKLLNIFTVNDKPVFFIFPVIAVVILNVYFEYFAKIYFALLMFFFYEWGCGNSLLGSGRDALVYFTSFVCAISIQFLCLAK
ncbi:hypothetical protein M153_8230001523 [Pseudoloma neurophilia]|uniref:Uncharacterized protein n=1 Tax=Pseudoloma neurophilia TaxID=146866 RepID=A0A0R0LVT6_9MICR|nr:hypothetical protein M153_8230001523 [Pseudoloma neurophilia]